MHPGSVQCHISSAPSQCHVSSATSQCQVTVPRQQCHVTVPDQQCHISSARSQCHVRLSATSAVTSDTVPRKQCHISSATSDTVPRQTKCHVSNMTGLPGQLANEPIADYKKRVHAQLAAIKAEEQRQLAVKAAQLQADEAATSEKLRLQAEADADAQARRKEARALLQRHEANSIEKLKYSHFEPNGDEPTPEEHHKEFMAKLVSRLVYTCNHLQSELANLQRVVRSHKIEHEDATRALDARVLGLEQAVPGPDAGASSSASSSRQLEERVDHRFELLDTKISQQQQTNHSHNNSSARPYKMPTFRIEKFDDYTHQESVLWWQGFTTELGIHEVPDHLFISALFINTNGGCQIWLSHMATIHNIQVSDLYKKVSWEDMTKEWKKRFIVDDAPTLAVNRIFTMAQGSTPTRDWLTDWQKIVATPDLDLSFPHLRREFYNRSCTSLSLALGDREQYSTFAEIINKARELIKTNRPAAYEKSTWQPTYVETIRTGPRQQQFAAAQSDSGDNPTATPASSDGDQVAVVQPQSNNKSRNNGKAKSASPAGNGQPGQFPWVKFGLTEVEYKVRGRYGSCYWCNSTKHKTSLLEELDPLTFTDFQWMPVPSTERLPKPHCNALMAQLRDYLHTAVPAPLMDVGAKVVNLHAYIAKIDREFKTERYDDIDTPLLYVSIQIGEATCSALIDCGASRNYISQDFMVRTGLGPRVRRQSQPTQVTLADGHTHKSIDRCIDAVPVYFAPHASEAVSFDILNTKFDMILGMSWLRSKDHPVNFFNRTVHVRDRNRVLVPCTLPLPHASINCHVVSATSMRASIIRDDIEEMGVCFLHALPPHDASSMDSPSDPRITELLDAYNDVFEGPHGVVPDRPIRHEIILEDGAFFSKLDLKSGYHQLEIRKEDRYKTAFKTRYGHFEWLVMPFGLTNALANFQAAMMTEFRHMLDRFVLIYLGDILVYSRSLDEHMEHLRTILEQLRQAKYKANRDKCEFTQQELEYLGHYVMPQDIHPLADKIEALRVWPEPTNTTNVRSFMGLAGYYQQFITGYSRIVAPMMRLQSPKMPFVFDDDARRSFQSLKTAMLMAPVLSIYDPTLPTRVTTDASGYCIGAVLEQHDGDDWHPVEYFSHKVPPINSLDDARKKELFAFVMALKRLRHFLLGRRRFTWVTDNNPLTYYKTQDTVSSTVGRWMYFIDQFDFTPKHVPDLSNCATDALSRRPDLCAMSHHAFTFDEEFQQHFIRAYQSDPDFGTLYAQLSSDHPPASHYRIVDGYLLLHSRGKDLLCVPRDRRLRTRLLGEYHDSRLAGNFGVNRTIARLRQRFRWPDLIADVTRYCDSCEVCRRSKPRNRIPYGKLHPMPIPREPGLSIAMDVTGPFPRDRLGHDGILTVVDRLSKYARFLPCKYYSTAPELARLLHTGWICGHGVPEDIVSDRDTRFMSVFWTALMQESGTTMKPSSTRHPQTDGQTERVHQTAPMMLRTLIRPDQKDWVDRLPDIEFAYNTSVHPAIGVTPFELHHGGRKGRIFADLLLPRPADIDAACLPASVRKYKELLTQARANMQKAQVRMQQQANRRRVPCPIRAGDLVWVSVEEFALEQDVSRKLFPKWFGPWSVKAAAGDEPDGPSFVVNIPKHLTVHPVFHASKLATYTLAKSDDFPDRRSQDPPFMDGHQEVDRVISDRKYGSKPRQYKVTFKACDRDDTRWISGADLKASPPLIYAHYEKQRLAQEASRPAPPTRTVVPPSDRQLRPRR
ncbi:hypothetical protein CBR_g2701 [Chara braunii]|uniref:Integrase catalytic domain-containing protein n=1 Tax=Chara braunii TaxID=69332 RepID=A0A388KDL4_CHABU|nr:hypothetical protein CBR_g2701 [Chara braunii]|eukprot:GBG68150.1 hypothetical protein CBR_g2701 [Chara braunii]